MKQKIIFIVFGLAFFNICNAQNTKLFYTIYGGFGSALHKEPLLSGSMGLGVEKSLSETVKLAIMPNYHSRGYNGTALINTVKVSYLDIPVDVEFSLTQNKKHVYLGLGGYWSYAIKGKYKNTLTVTGNTDWQKMAFGEATTDNRSNIDYGALLNLGAYIPMYRNTLKFGFQTMIGLKNVVPKDRQIDPSIDKINLLNFSAYLAIGLWEK